MCIFKINTKTLKHDTYVNYNKTVVNVTDIHFDALNN